MASGALAQLSQANDDGPIVGVGIDEMTAGALAQLSQASEDGPIVGVGIDEMASVALFQLPSIFQSKSTNPLTNHGMYR